MKSSEATPLRASILMRFGFLEPPQVPLHAIYDMFGNVRRSQRHLLGIGGNFFHALACRDAGLTHGPLLEVAGEPYLIHGSRMILPMGS